MAFREVIDWRQGKLGRRNSRQHQGGMLEISLGPALIPRKFIIQDGRRFLITVRQRWLKPDFVTGAAQERRFYKIMTHDWPAPDSKPGEFAQPAVSHKRCRSDNRVMPPEYRISKLDRGKPCGEQDRKSTRLNSSHV